MDAGQPPETVAEAVAERVAHLLPPTERRVEPASSDDQDQQGGPQPPAQPPSADNRHPTNARRNGGERSSGTGDRSSQPLSTVEIRA